MHPRDLSDHIEYRAGRGPEEVARELGLDPAELITLSSNENPHGPSPQAVEAIRTTAETVNTYPKAAHTDLVDALADRWNVESRQLWLANGGDGALDYLSRAMLDPGDTVLVPEPGFAYYGMSARFHHGEVATYTITKESDFTLDADTILADYDGERIVYLTSPNNPTGGRFTLDAIETIAAETTEQTLVVVDEAYGEYADGPSAIELLDDRDDIAVLRTFSKAYGLAGIRLGYAVTPSEWADAYARVNTPFAASQLACRAGLAALDDQAHVERSVESARWARAEFRERLTVPTWPSQANFVLAEVGDANEVTDAMEERGIIIRDATSFGLSECVRISCGTRKETDAAITALNEVIATL